MSSNPTFRILQTASSEVEFPKSYDDYRSFMNRNPNTLIVYEDKDIKINAQDIEQCVIGNVHDLNQKSLILGGIVVVRYLGRQSDGLFPRRLQSSLKHHSDQELELIFGDLNVDTRIMTGIYEKEYSKIQNPMLANSVLALGLDEC